MNSFTAINNLKCLAMHPAGELAISSDPMTIMQRQEGMAPATQEQLQKIIFDTERFYKQKGHTPWVPLYEGTGSKRLGIEAGILLQMMKGANLDNPLPPEALESHSVVTFIIDGQRIQADRELVAKASPVFEKMLCGSFSEANLDVIELQEIEPELFCEFITFTETEELSQIDDPERIFALYSLAERYQAEAFEQALAKRRADLTKPDELHQLITVNPRFFVQTASCMTKETNVKQIVNGVSTFIKDPEDSAIEGKEELILTAKQALVAWINQNDVPITYVASGKKPAEFFRWLGDSLRDLEYADFRACRISNDDLDVLQHCPNLQSLNISGCKQLKEDALDALKYCPNLQRLNISDCTQLNPDALNLLKHYPNLQRLNISDCRQLNPDALNLLKHCPNLQSLDISWCLQFKEDALDVLKHCPNLQRLTIFRCTQLKVDALDVLKHCPNLQRLNISGCKQLKEDALDVLKHCPNLQRLAIRGCKQLKEDALDVLKYCPNLQSLDIFNCTQLKEDALDVLQHCSNLQSLNISECTQLKEDALDVLKHCPNLQSLNISWCTQLKEDALDVLQHCPNLQSLNISECKQLKEDTLDVLKHCPNLQSLVIAGCTQLKADALDVLQHCPNLQSLDIFDCTQLMKAARILFTLRPHLKAQ